MLYYAIIGFQAFCIFHSYKNRKNFYWYAIIFFLPIIGALIYLFSEIINWRKVRVIYNHYIDLFFPKKRIRVLKKRLKKSNTFKNNVNIGDFYKERKKFSKAVFFYEKALINDYKDHAITLNKALECYFELNNFDKVIEYGNQIDLNTIFRDSIFMYAIALEKRNYINKAEKYFRKTNKKYTNYHDRFELCKFLIRNKKENEAKTILGDIIFEIDNMTSKNQTKLKILYLKSKKLLKEI